VAAYEALRIAARLQIRRDVSEPVPRHDHIDAERIGQRDRRFLRQLSWRVRAHHGEQGELPGHVHRVDPQHKAHRLQETQQRPGRARLHVDPHRGAVVGQGQVVLDVPAGAEHQRLGGGARGQVLGVLRGQAVQPGKPVLAGDPQDAVVRPVHHARRAGQCPLLRERVAVVRGDPRVGPLRGHSPGLGQ
jgi:hypothetical protein